MTHTTTTVPIEDLYLAATELVDLLPELAALVPEPSARVESESAPGGSKRVAAPAPWNDAAAMVFYEIHGDARRFESLLTLRLFGRAKFRPGSGPHTVDCIRRLPVLIDHGRAQHLDDMDLADVTSALLAWPRRVRVLLGQARPGDERATPVPGGAVCPYCGERLVLSSGWRALEANASAECRRCRDDDGHPMRWPVTELVSLQHEELITAETARDRFGVSTSTVRSWKHRGRIHHYGEDEHGRHLYRLRDVLALHEKQQPVAAGG
jgi:hypothetical protein